MKIIVYHFFVATITLKEDQGAILVFKIYFENAI
jgi:hypothetical protein